MSLRRFAFLVEIRSCHFPLKEKYDRQFRSTDGVDEIQSARQKDNNAVSHVTKNTSTWIFPTLQNLFPLLAEAAVAEPRPRNREC